MADEKCLDIQANAHVTTLTLNRSAVRNAFNPQLINELSTICEQLAIDPAVRVVVLAGAGSHFSAGADLAWMRAMAGYTREQNYADALALANMLANLNGLPQRLIGVVQGGAYGGALGLLACCDTVLCGADCKFAFSEVRLGISPATIAPYVIAKIGISHARDLFLSARVFDAGQARQIGLVHRVVAPDELPAAAAAEIAAAPACPPRAVAYTKALLAQLQPVVTDEEIDFTAQLIAQLRVSPEGQEGLSAFLEKRRPSWNPEISSSG